MNTLFLLSFPLVTRGLSMASLPGHNAPARTSTTPAGSGSSVVSRPRPPPRQNMVSDRTALGTLDISSLGIGTISWNKADSPELTEVVKEAMARGLNFYDTAERYGSSGLEVAFGLGWGQCERECGKYIREASEHIGGEVSGVVATKFTPSPWRQTARSVVEACAMSRERLAVDAIDLYQIHMPDIVQPLKGFGLDNPSDEAFWDGLAECYLQGLVKNVGVSNYGPTLVARAQEALAKRGVPLASNQINYSLLYRRSGAQATVDACQDLGVRTLAYFPLAMGLLTGKYGGGGRIDNKRSALESRDLMSYGESMMPLLAAMKQVAAKHGKKTVAQVALNWVMSKGAIPVAGARTVRHVEDNVGALGWRLGDEDLALLEAVADSLGDGDLEFEGAGFKRSSEKFVGYGVEKWRLE